MSERELIDLSKLLKRFKKSYYPCDLTDISRLELIAKIVDVEILIWHKQNELKEDAS